MSGLVLTLGSAVINALAFSGSNFMFSKLQSHDEIKRHNRAMEQLQAAQDAYERKRIETLDFINEKLRQQNHAEHTFRNVDLAIKEYNLVTNQTLRIPPKPKFTDFYQPTDKQKMGEIAFIFIGMTAVYLIAQKV